MLFTGLYIFQHLETHQTQSVLTSLISQVDSVIHLIKLSVVINSIIFKPKGVLNMNHLVTR